MSKVFCHSYRVLQKLKSSQSIDKAVRLKELEVKLQRLALKDKELKYLNDLETKKLEQQREICELELASQVPPFHEKDKYFTLFERVASLLKRPKNLWMHLL